VGSNDVIKLWPKEHVIIDCLGSACPKSGGIAQRTGEDLCITTAALNAHGDCGVSGQRDFSGGSVRHPLILNVGNRLTVYHDTDFATAIVIFEEEDIFAGITGCERATSRRSSTACRPSPSASTRISAHRPG